MSVVPRLSEGQEETELGTKKGHHTYQQKNSTKAKDTTLVV